MSARVRYAIVVEPLAGTHLSYFPWFQAAWVSFQPCGRSWMNRSPRLSASGRNGRISLVPSDWFQTGLPLGSVTGRGSPNPRTPRSAPK
jgi:hypothetical protein